MAYEATAPRATWWSRAVPVIVAVAIPLVVGGVSSLLTADAMTQFAQFAQPPLSPPAWLFPVAWTVLYVLMGLASYVLYAHVPATPEATRTRRSALVVYTLQLALNFVWSLVFFGARAHEVAFVVLLAMWAMIAILVGMANRVNRTAAYLLVPYLLWTTFAGYLNLGVAILN